MCTRDNYSLEAFCWYVPEFTALFRPLSDIALTRTTGVVAAYCVLVTAYLAAPLVPAPARAASTWFTGIVRGGWRL